MGLLKRSLCSTLTSCDILCVANKLQSIAPVKLWQFVVAQLFVFPKIALSVFVGSRAAALADGDQREKMDKGSCLLTAWCITLGYL
jgi:hypothetical protein